MSELGRELTLQPDLNAATKALRKMLEFTPNPELVERRRQNEEGAARRGR